MPLVLCLPVSIALPGFPASGPLHAAPPQPPASDGGVPGPDRSTEQTSDRLAEPVLPESPTQVEVGRNLYYFHCMPCHGDRGQGLTDEFRAIWVEDHQNCWGRGCHNGRSELSAFYIPKAVPPVSGTSQALAAFQTPDQLFAFLQATQPPQRPGALSEGEYWALTAFLLHENGRLPEGTRLGPGTEGGMILAAALGLLLVILVVPRIGKRRRDAIPTRQATEHQSQT